MRCPQCNAESRETARFCDECGARLELPCPACGVVATAGKKFCGDCGSRLDGGGSDAIAPSGQAPSPSPVDERRWVTVLFADVVGFTAMSERMDPEDVKALAHRCAERLAEEVRRFDGTVINVMGDAVLAVFGAPVAHEDDAERAVRAALAMRDSLDPSAGTAPVEVHIGINTGEVVAGLLGPVERHEYTVMGDTVNTTTRLMGAAPPGSVFVGEETYRATRRMVRYRELAPIDAKGKERPLSAWEALDVTPLPEARPLGTAPLVGRDEELALLAGIWTIVAREARPHLVTVLGEPGIGKSRLVAEFERGVLGDALVLHGRCLPYGEALGYWALGTALKEAAGIAAEDDAETARARLGELVLGSIGPGQTEADATEIARHLALLIGLDTEGDRTATAPDQRTLHASARRFLEALAGRRSLCLLLEDIHWADDALLDLVEFVASRAHEAPLLIVAQARPELLDKRPGWGRGVRAFTTVPLEPLGERAGRDLVLALCRERGLAEDIAERVGRGAGGNPLFAEELVATVAERGGVAATGMPSAIKALISARLDALPPEERGMLQRAAVFGKVFWEGGLRALGGDGALTDQLDALEHKDLLRAQPRSRFPDDREYAFKHDLIRDAAYDMLPRADRRALHAGVADWIERTGGERTDELLDLLAHHAVEADQQERALGYLTGAAERAHRAAAHREEAALLGKAIEIAAHTGRSGMAADLRVRRGKALASVALWTGARADLEAGLEGLAPDGIERRAEVLMDLASVCFWLLDVPSVRHHATAALELAEEVGRADLQTGAVGWLACADSADGDLISAIDRHQQVITRSQELGITPPGFVLPLYSATVYWLGRPGEGIGHSRGAVRAARELNDPSMMMYGLPHLGLALAGRGHYDEAARVFEEARRFGREYGVDTLLARSIAMSAGFHLDLFDYAGHEAIAEEARDYARTLGFPPPLISAGIDLLLNFARRLEVSRAEKIVDEVAETVETAAAWHGWLWRMRLAEGKAEIALARGDWEETIRLAGEAIEQSRAKGRVKYQALGLGTRAKALASLGRTKAATADLRSAIELARPVGDPALFLGAAAALLAIDGDDALATEARAAVERITAALPDRDTRRRFEAAEPVRRVLAVSA